MTQGVGEIEALIRQAEADDGFATLGVPGGADLARFMTHELGDRYRTVGRVYWRVSAAGLRGAIDAIRTALAELVGELRAGLPEGEHVPSPELADQAIQVAIYGSRNRVTVTSATASDGAAASAAEPTEVPSSARFWTASRRLGAAVVGFFTVAGAIAAILALHPKL
jgi:hypothetical protein